MPSPTWRHPTSVLLAILLSFAGRASSAAAELPRGQDVVEFTAIGKGLSLHALFQSNMVLQRDRPIPVWGWAEPGETVTVSFDGKTLSATAAQDRSWKLTLPALPASDVPRQMVIKGKQQSLTLDNILIGDIWLLGGQSNMEFEIVNADNGDLETASANFRNIRLLTIPQGVNQAAVPSFARLHEWSGWSSRHFRKGYWDICTPRTVRDFSAIGYVFARRVHMASQVPLGVIDVSRGGTSLETWIPIDVLRSMQKPEVEAMLADWDKRIAEYDPRADLQRRIQQHRQRVKAGKAPAGSPDPTDLSPGPAADMNRPGNSYGGMITPIAGFEVKGAIFHQGYTNAAGEATNAGMLYLQMFPAMIASWRKAFNNPPMAFGIVSLCTDTEPQTLDDFLLGLADNGCDIREAQYKTFAHLRQAGDKNIGYASSYDQRRNWFHPQIKTPVGERIARWALATQYGFERQIRWLGPAIRDMKVEPGRIILHLDSEARPYNDGPIYGFAIAGSDRKFYPANAVHLTIDAKTADRKTIVLSSPFVPKPIHYRFAWHRNPMANMKSADKTDLPMPIQRSDSWTMNELYEAYTGKAAKSATSLSRPERREFQEALRKADQQRLLQEAQRYVEGRRAQGGGK